MSITTLTDLSPLELGLRGDPVLVVSCIEVGKGGLVGLANLLELLNMAARCREVDLGNLEGRSDRVVNF